MLGFISGDDDRHWRCMLFPLFVSSLFLHLFFFWSAKRALFIVPTFLSALSDLREDSPVDF